MDGLKKGVEVKMDGMKDNIKYWKKDMEGWKEGLTKFLQERLPNGEKVVDKSQNENIEDVNNENIGDLKKDMEGLTKLL